MEPCIPYKSSSCFLLGQLALEKDLVLLTLGILVACATKEEALARANDPGARVCVYGECREGEAAMPNK